MGSVTQKPMQSYVKYPPCKKQSSTYTGPITISQYERFQNIREMLAKDGFNIDTDRKLRRAMSNATSDIGR
jgi:hypothetical protein